MKPCEAPISKNDKIENSTESKEEKDEAEDIEDIEVIAISSNADDDGIKMETIEVHEEDDDTMTIDKSAEAAMQILNGLNPLAINPLLPPHMTGNVGVTNTPKSRIWFQPTSLTFSFISRDFQNFPN